MNPNQGKPIHPDASVIAGAIAQLTMGRGLPPVGSEGFEALTSSLRRTMGGHDKAVTLEVGALCLATIYGHWQLALSNALPPEQAPPTLDGE